MPRKKKSKNEPAKAASVGKRGKAAASDPPAKASRGPAIPGKPGKSLGRGDSRKAGHAPAADGC